MLVNRIRNSTNVNPGSQLKIPGKIAVLSGILTRMTFLSLGMLCSGCIDEFAPNITAYENLLTIDGSIIKGDSIQQVLISTSTKVQNPEFNPVRDCKVSVLDRSGNEFFFYEESHGVYQSAIPDSYLGFGSEFKLMVETPGGRKYTSSYETLLHSSPIDSVYFEVADYQTSTETFEKGLQLYADLLAPNDASKYYLWKVEETWEIQTFYTIEGFFEKGAEKDPVYDPWPGKYTLCWSTATIAQGFTSSTVNSTINEKKQVPLSYVASTSPKINHKYSVLVKQFSLGEKAYAHHNQNNIATSGSEGLYQTQPAQSQSNIYNINDPSETVLGYFWASSYSQKRLFFTGPLEYLNDNHCDYVHPIILQGNMTLLKYLQLLNRDVYLVVLEFGAGPRDVALWGYPPNEICINCRAEGGTTIKPEFWE